MVAQFSLQAMGKIIETELIRLGHTGDEHANDSVHVRLGHTGDEHANDRVHVEF